VAKWKLWKSDRGSEFWRWEVDNEKWKDEGANWFLPLR
jgi:hypothetical protein